MSLTKRYYEDLSERGFGETGDRAVCLGCIEDEGLRERIAGSCDEPTCTFCGATSTDDTSPIAVNLDELMRVIMEAINFFYMRTIEVLYFSDDVTARLHSQEVAHAVCEGCVSDAVMEAIEDIIDADEWCEEPALLPPDRAMRLAWDDFRDRVKHHSRFVFLSVPEASSGRPDEFTAAEILAKVVDLLDACSAFVPVAAGREFWRGRMTDTAAAVGYDAARLGSPPKEKAAANRMSPAGISMFYGSEDVDSVVAEISARSTKSHAVVGKFVTTHDMTFVDLTHLPPVPSYFTETGRRRYHDIKFLRSFARDLGAPVVLDGMEHIDYVPTQVVTEYLRFLGRTKIDGILFPSAQNGHTSVVVFCGPEGCADHDNITRKTDLVLDAGTVHFVKVPPKPNP